jgi:tetratricopeptide (TPR) repeat protein
MAQFSLGLVLYERGDREGATRQFRRVLELAPNHAEARCSLGMSLQRQGKFVEALQELQRGHQLGVRQPGWNTPSAQWVKQCQYLVQLDEKLAAALAGQAPAPAGAVALLELADLCRHYKGYHAAAARLFAAALAADPPPAPAVLKNRHEQAACSAVLAAAGRGQDSGRLKPEEKASLRRQALAWLRADLDRLAGLLSSGPGKAGAPVGKASQPPDSGAAAATLRAQEQLTRWQSDGELASVREDRELTRLPEDERQAWQKFWTDVGTLQKRADSCFTATTYSGALTDLRREVAHQLSWTAGKTYVLDVRSRQFHPLLRLQDDSGAELAENDSGSGREARVLFTAEQSGAHRVIVTSFGGWGAGNYALEVREFTGPREGR